MKQMKTRLLTIMMSVTMIFAMAPLTVGIAFADDGTAVDTIDEAVQDMPEVDVPEPPEFHKDSVEPAPAEKAMESRGALPEGCVFTIGKKIVTKTSAKGKGWTFKYKSGTGYLTLNKAKIKTARYDDNGGYCFGIFAEGMNLKITLKGKNYVSGTAIPNYGSVYVAIDSEKKLTITGKGSLSVSNTFCGIYANEKMYINGTKVTAKGAYYGLYADGPVNIKKSRVTLSSDEFPIYACSDGQVTINKSTVTCNSAEQYGIYSNGELNISGSKVTANGKFVGLYTANQLTIDKSKVTAKAAFKESPGFGIMANEAASIKDSNVTAIGELIGILVSTDLSLANTSKGYTTRVEAECTGEEDNYAFAINAGHFYCDGFRITSPEGGTLVDQGYGSYVIDQEGAAAKHVVIVPKKANPLKIEAKTATVKYSLLKTADQTLPIGKLIKFVKAGKGELTYAKTKGNSKILVDEATGDVTVMTGLKKGTYKVKIKVTAAGDTTYLAKSRTVTATVIVK